jgi:hypothetical protein
VLVIGNQQERRIQCGGEIPAQKWFDGV